MFNFNVPLRLWKHVCQEQNVEAKHKIQLELFFLEEGWRLYLRATKKQKKQEEKSWYDFDCCCLRMIKYYRLRVAVKRKRQLQCMGNYCHSAYVPACSAWTNKTCQALSSISSHGWCFIFIAHVTQKDLRQRFNPKCMFLTDVACNIFFRNTLFKSETPAVNIVQWNTGWCRQNRLKRN